MSYLRPVDPTNGRISSYSAHTRRTTPSSEAGVDYYCPIGTPVRAAGDGVVVDVAGGIGPATGRYVTVDLDDGRRVRYLHLSRWNTHRGQRVSRGQVVGYSGASGYGSEFFGASSLATIPGNTGGPHVHTTLWPGHYYQFGRYPVEPTLDFERYVGSDAPASGGASNFEEDDMTPDQDTRLKNIEAILGGLQNKVDDKNVGLTHVSLRAESAATNAANIASEVRNLIVDPNVGVLQAIGKVGAGSASVNVPELAAALKAALGGAVADELAKRLAS